MNNESINKNTNESIKELNESLDKAKIVSDKLTPSDFNTETKRAMQQYSTLSVEDIEDEKPESKKEQIQPQNRKQKRMMEKRQRRNQKLLEKRVMDYIRKHPEAIKIELDEDKVKEVETQHEDK